MDLTRSARTLAVIMLVVVALSALAGRCDGPDSDDFPLSYEGPVCVARDAVPTAIPTEEWTPEWLSGWSDLNHEATRKRHERTARDLAQGNVSMAGVRRAELMVEVVGKPLDDTLREADVVVTGMATGQKLGVAREGEWLRSYLLTRIEDEKRSFIVAQRTTIECTEHGIMLGEFPDQALLKVGEAYALLLSSEQPVSGASRALPHVFLEEADGSLKNLWFGDDMKSIDELRQRFEAAR